MDQVVVAGGTESLSTMPQRRCASEPGPGETPSRGCRRATPSTPDAPAFDMSITVGENTARQAGADPRATSDEWAATAHARAIASIDNGWFAEEIVPVEVVAATAGPHVRADEHPRRGTTVERSPRCRRCTPSSRAPPSPPATPPASTTRPPRSSWSRDEYAAAHGLTPLARIRSWASVGVEPRAHRHGADARHPEGARPRRPDDRRHRPLRDQRGVLLGARSPPSRTLGLDPTIVNVNGSGCSLGHPIAATGARMVVTMVHELAPPRRAARLRLDVRRRRHGLADGDRGQRLTDPVRRDSLLGVLGPHAGEQHSAVR